jgi:hypothetical protein
MLNLSDSCVQNSFLLRFYCWPLLLRTTRPESINIVSLRDRSWYMNIVRWPTFASITFVCFNEDFN